MFERLGILIGAIIIAVTATIYQQATSPDMPEKATISIKTNDYIFRLPTVHEGNQECLIDIDVADSSITGEVFYRHFRTDEKWKSNKLIRLGDKLITILPNQKPLVKLEYYLVLNDEGTDCNIKKDNPVVVRFQNEVHKILIYPYVIFLFFGLILSCFSGGLAIYKIDSFRRYSITTFYFIAAAFVFSFIIQLLATQHLFIEISIFNDMKFYRLILIFVFWLWAFIANRKKESTILTIIASVLMLIILAIPQKYVLMWFIN